MWSSSFVPINCREPPRVSQQHIVITSAITGHDKVYAQSEERWRFQPTLASSTSSALSRVSLDTAYQPFTMMCLGTVLECGRLSITGTLTVKSIRKGSKKQHDKCQKHPSRMCSQCVLRWWTHHLQGFLWKRKDGNHSTHSIACVLTFSISINIMQLDPDAMSEKTCQVTVTGIYQSNTSRSQDIRAHGQSHAIKHRVWNQREAARDPRRNRPSVFCIFKKGTGKHHLHHIAVLH